MYMFCDAVIYTANWYLYVDSMTSVAVKLSVLNANNAMRMGKDGY